MTFIYVKYIYEILVLSYSGEAHLGYSCEEMMSRSWYEFIHPDDLHRAVSTHKNCKCQRT